MTIQSIRTYQIPTLYYAVGSHKVTSIKDVTDIHGRQFEIYKGDKLHARIMNIDNVEIIYK